MIDIAWTSVLADKPDSEGRYWTLGLATRGVAGYSPIREDDPATFYKAKGPTRFKTIQEADAEALRRNELELGITGVEANEIVLSSVAAQY